MENLTFAFLHKRNWDSVIGVVNRIRARRSEIVHDSREYQEICLFQTGHFMSGVHSVNYLTRTADSFYTHIHSLFRIFLGTKLLRSWH